MAAWKCRLREAIRGTQSEADRFGWAQNAGVEMVADNF